MTGSYQICVRCIMDTTDPDIVFDENGVCNHCRNYDSLSARMLPSINIASRELEKLAAQIKASGVGKQYDCLVGVSGGVDSTYVAYLVKNLGLRPLAVHLDNGWDAELAVSNIEKVLNKLEIDLYTHVLNWEEFKDIQVAFLKASVPDGEIPTDHAIAAVIYQTAIKFGIKYVISGSNIVTEGILPTSWTYGIQDWMYIHNVHGRFGNLPLKTFPHMSLLDRLNYNLIRRVVTVRILNFIPYSKAEVMRILQDELGWKYYGGKHHESIYTRFFQGYILPRKFRIDKRLAHFSTLICSGQMTREKALEEIQSETYPAQLQQEDYVYSIKKLGLNEEEFKAIMVAPVKSYRDYPNQDRVMQFLRKILKILQKFGFIRGNTSL
jgi:N-acetyl sugar amidotransferase